MEHTIYILFPNFSLGSYIKWLVILQGLYDFQATSGCGQSLSQSLWPLTWKELETAKHNRPAPTPSAWCTNSHVGGRGQARWEFKKLKRAILTLNSAAYTQMLSKFRCMLLFQDLKGVSHEILRALFWHVWIDLGLCEKLWLFLIFSVEPLILYLRLKFRHG